MNNYADALDNEDEFKQSVKDALSARAFGAVEQMKTQMANDFIKPQEDEDE